MGYNFVTVDRDQAFLMPPSMRDWLTEGHLAWFVLDVVSELDLTEFLAAYRADGRGGAAYDPAMILAIWLYAYCVGEPSTRRIERRCVEDVAFRVLAGNHLPDHSTLSRFRKQHADALVGLFAQILRLCHEAGLVDLSLLALDGTKVTANAARVRGPRAEGPGGGRRIVAGGHGRARRARRIDHLCSTGAACAGGGRASRTDS